MPIINLVYEAPEPRKELCFTARTASSIVYLIKSGSPTEIEIEISRDGSTWSDYTFGSSINLSAVGSMVYFRNKSTTTTGFTKDGNNLYYFSLYGSLDCTGDVTYLINKNGTKIITADNCFLDLFYRNGNPNTALKTAPKLPAEELTTGCYGSMFRYCDGLEAAPDLPALTLKDNCYNGMFYNCTALTTVGKISATTLGSNSMGSMFSGCTALNTLPKLYATTLTYRCYSSMFYNCSSIKISATQTGEYVNAYRIPREGTGTDGYQSLNYMFSGNSGTYTSHPVINTTYYTSNTVV